VVRIRAEQQTGLLCDLPGAAAEGSTAVQKARGLSVWSESAVLKSLQSLVNTAVAVQIARLVGGGAA
jgi:hypothetical protein